MSLPTFKVILIGDENTGKTSIIHRYTRNSFPEIHFPTPLPDETTQNVNNYCNLTICDTAGAEEWRSINPVVFRNSNAVIFVSSYDNEQSLCDLKDIWFPMVNDNLGNDVPAILVVNKDDIDENLKNIEKNQIDQIKTEINACEFISVSAKKNKNVDKLFELVAKKIAENPPASNQSVVINDKNTKNDENGRGCGC